MILLNKVYYKCCISYYLIVIYLQLDLGPSYKQNICPFLEDLVHVISSFNGDKAATPI
jgi:hypothetical protein